MGNIRIRTTVGGEDKHITVNLNQSFENLEILSLKISQDKIYRSFSADYGVLVGRVLANDGLGVPNAKISVFIPITEEDSENERIRSVYPYKQISDKNNEGVRYNLLSKDGRFTRIYETTQGTLVPVPPKFNLSLPRLLANNCSIDGTATYLSGVRIIKTNCQSNATAPAPLPDGLGWEKVSVDAFGNTVWTDKVDSGEGAAVGVGTFPSSHELCDDDTLIEVYEKYYKFTTKTNASGDYMIFGVPVGNQVVHMDMDLSDIGDLSFKPLDLVAAGISPSLFDKDGDELVYKENKDIDKLVQINTQNISVDVKPLWGDSGFNEIGITRADFKVNINTNPTSIVCFSFGMTVDDVDPADNWFDDNDGTFYNGTGGEGGMEIREDGYGPNVMSNLNPFVSGTRFYKPTTELAAVTHILPTITAIRYDENGEELPHSEGNYSVLYGDEAKRHGFIVLHLPCYSNRIITDEYGDRIQSNDDKRGLPTRGIYKININPNHENYSGFNVRSKLELNGSSVTIDENAEKFNFKMGRVYTVSMKFFRSNSASHSQSFKYALGSGGEIGNVPDFQESDAVNGFLFFGNRAKELDGNQRGGGDWICFTDNRDTRKYYKSNTSFIDITNYMEDLLVEDKIALEFPKSTIYGKVKVTEQDNVEDETDQYPKTAPSKGDKVYFITGCRKNNFKLINKYIR